MEILLGGFDEEGRLNYTPADQTLSGASRARQQKDLAGRVSGAKEFVPPEIVRLAGASPPNLN